MIYNGLETMIASKLRVEDSTWLPLNRAASLEDIINAEEDFESFWMKKEKDIEGKLELYEAMIAQIKIKLLEQQ